MSEPSEDELRRLAGLLAEAIQLSRRTRQSFEQELGFAGGYLSKVFHDKTPLGLGSLLRLLAALGISPKDFFQVAYATVESSADGRKIVRELVERHGGEPEDPTDFDRRVREALARIVGAPGR